MNTTSIPVPSPIPTPIPPDVWLARRYRLPPATAKAIAELAFTVAPAWNGRRA